MSRQRNPKRDESRKLYLESRGELMPKDIAKMLDVSPSMISKWKSQDKWEAILNGEIPDLPYDSPNGKGKPESNGKGKRNRQNYQAPKGNQFAKGNKGNTKPKTGNKNAVKHGLYETISFDFLDKDEKDMVVNMLSNEYDPLMNINETIVELRIRQRRMMRRIQELEDNLTEVEKDTLSIHRMRKDGVDIDIVDGYAIEIPKYGLKEIERHETSYRKITDILVIEEALTRITDSLLRAIKTRNDIEESMDFKRPGQLLKNKKLEKELEMFDADDNDDEPLRVEIISKSSRDGG